LGRDGSLTSASADLSRVATSRIKKRTMTRTRKTRRRRMKRKRRDVPDGKMRTTVVPRIKLLSVLHREDVK
jgi:hypothetical protein